MLKSLPYLKIKSEPFKLTPGQRINVCSWNVDNHASVQNVHTDRGWLISCVKFLCTLFTKKEINIMFSILVYAFERGSKVSIRFVRSRYCRQFMTNWTAPRAYRTILYLKMTCHHSPPGRYLDISLQLAFVTIYLLTSPPSHVVDEIFLQRV